MNIDKIIKSIPRDYSKHAVRDISLLTNSIFAETYDSIFKKEFSIEFSSVFWFIEGCLTRFYRSQSEQDNFAKVLGERALRRKIDYTRNLAKKLMEYTDWFYGFLKKNKNLENFVKNKKEFVDNYRIFFAYHQAVYWTGDYISKLSLKKNKEKSKKIIKILDKAYKYNEMVVPDAEKYFKKLKIDKFLYDEAGKGYKFFSEKERKKGIGILFIKGKRTILNWKDSKKLEDFIKKRNKESLKKIKEIKGIVAQKGKFKGKVYLVKDFKNLKNVKKGMVLVTPQTRPQFNKFIKQAGAIITDEGGMLCHASMLARELKIPCIVGTKIATKVLKTGDRVEIDFKKGLIRIIE